MEDIRRRARASTGSIYHHFRSKEQLAAELYCEGVRVTQKVGLEAMVKHAGAERGVRALVRAYLEWVSENPSFATYLLTSQHAEFRESTEALVSRMNQEFAESLRDWVETRVGRGELPALPYDLYRAILFGPSEQFARYWLAGRTTTDLKEAARILAESAWRALQAHLRESRGAN
jgi:AcrR family transcriptional regulator